MGSIGREAGGRADRQTEMGQVIYVRSVTWNLVSRTQTYNIHRASRHTVSELGQEHIAGILRGGVCRDGRGLREENGGTWQIRIRVDHM